MDKLVLFVLGCSISASMLHSSAKGIRCDLDAKDYSHWVNAQGKCCQRHNGDEMAPESFEDDTPAVYFDGGLQARCGIEKNKAWFLNCFGVTGRASGGRVGDGDCI